MCPYCSLNFVVYAKMETLTEDVDYFVSLANISSRILVNDLCLNTYFVINPSTNTLFKGEHDLVLMLCIFRCNWAFVFILSFTPHFLCGVPCYILFQKQFQEMKILSPHSGLKNRLGHTANQPFITIAKQSSGQSSNFTGWGESKQGQIFWMQRVCVLEQCSLLPDQEAGISLGLRSRPPNVPVQCQTILQ